MRGKAYAADRHVTAYRRGAPATPYVRQELQGPLPACAGMLDAMFPEPEFPTYPSDPKYLAEVEYAKSFCNRCAVRVRCLAGALQRKEPAGVWGGTTVSERKDLIRSLQEQARTAQVAVSVEELQRNAA